MNAIQHNRDTTDTKLKYFSTYLIPCFSVWSNTYMARLSSALLITSLLIFVCYSLPSPLDARKILQMEVPSLQQGPLQYSRKFIDHLTNNKRVLVSSIPSPGAGHRWSWIYNDDDPCFFMIIMSVVTFYKIFSFPCVLKIKMHVQ